MVGGTADCRVDFLESMVGRMLAVGFMKSLVPGSIALMVSCLLRAVVRTRVVSRTGEVMRAEAAAGLGSMAVYCAAPTVVRAVG